MRTVLGCIIVLGAASAACGTAPGGSDAGGTGIDGGADAGQPVCPGGTPKFPSGRSDFAAAVDIEGNRVAVFGGDPGVAVNCQPNPQFNGATWIFDVACGAWSPVAGAGPSPRARHVGVYDSRRRRFVIFGGRFRAGTTGPYTNYNDTWAFDLATLTWSPLAPGGTLPPGMSSAAAVYDPTSDRLIVYGGNTSTSGAIFAPSGEVYALAFGANTWVPLPPATAERPPARLFHALALDRQRGRLVVFSGGDQNAFTGPFLGDAWTFELGTRTWTRLAPQGLPPTNRIRAAMAEDPDRDRVLVFAGHDDQPVGERNDLWALDFTRNIWTRLREGDVLKNPSTGFCSFPADFTTPDLASPERREALFLGYLPGSKRQVAFGGRTDCGVVNDVWTLDPAAGAWTPVLPTFTGEGCVRSGKQNCTSLCF